MLEYTSRAFQNRVVCCLSCPVGLNVRFPSGVQKRVKALYVRALAFGQGAQPRASFAAGAASSGVLWPSAKAAARRARAARASSQQPSSSCRESRKDDRRVVFLCQRPGSRLPRVSATQRILQNSTTLLETSESVTFVSQNKLSLGDPLKVRDRHTQPHFKVFN